jgi:ferric-dicitrate binding protein FerR (iron transport regulator)
MSDHPFADAAARVLRAARASVGPRTAREPERAIAALAQAIRASTRRRRARSWAASGAAALAAAAVVLLVRQGGLTGTRTARSPAIAAPAPTPPRSPASAASPGRGATWFTLMSSTPGHQDLPGGSRPSQRGPHGAKPRFGHAPAVFVSGGETRVPGTGARFEPGDTLASGDETLVLAGSDGTQVRLAPGSAVALVRSDAMRWFQLEAGAMDAHVAKLAAGERFVVATPDRQIEVRGTRFRVSLVRGNAACQGGAVTRIAVDEGVVTVRAPGGAEGRVAAGERWPADCSARPSVIESNSGHGAATEARALGVRAGPRPRSARPALSTLGTENDLFGQATRAERDGDSATALRLLDELIARYPASPLREAAVRERLRLWRTRAVAPEPRAD